MKYDSNAGQIRRALVDAGATVEYIVRAAGPGLQGVPDLVVGYKDVNYLIEVKRPGEKLSGDQPEWHARWRGQKAVATSPEEALKVIGAL